MIRRGYTLVELALVLIILAVLTGLAAAPLAHVRNVLAVRSARAEIAGLVAVTRSTAIVTGGAVLVVDVGSGSAWIRTPSGAPVGDVHDIAARHGVQLDAARPLIEMRYDALGIGRMNNAVLRVRAGGVTGTLTVSAYGRVRQS